MSELAIEELVDLMKPTPVELLHEAERRAGVRAPLRRFVSLGECSRGDAIERVIALRTQLSSVAHPLLIDTATEATVEAPSTTTEDPPEKPESVGTTGEAGTTGEDRPLVPARTVKAFARRLGFDADPLPTPTLVTLRLRCEVEMGLRRPYAVMTAPIPASVGKHGRTLASSVIHLFECRWLKDAGEPAPLTIGFMTKWASMTEWEFRTGKAQLVRAKWLVLQEEHHGIEYWLPRREGEA